MDQLRTSGLHVFRNQHQRRMEQKTYSYVEIVPTDASRPLPGSCLWTSNRNRHSQASTQTPTLLSHTTRAPGTRDDLEEDRGQPLELQKFLEERAQKIHHLHNPTNPKPKTKTNKNNNPRNSHKKEGEIILNLPPTLTLPLPILFPNPGHTQMRQRIFVLQASGTGPTTGLATRHT